jgi:hypothetical protein
MNRKVAYVSGKSEARLNGIEDEMKRMDGKKNEVKRLR